MKKLIALAVIATSLFLLLPQAGATYTYNPFDKPTYKTAVLKTEHFWIEYSKAEYFDFYITPDNNQNNIADRVDEIADLLEDMWDAEVDGLGYSAPGGSEEDSRVLVILDEDYDYIWEGYFGQTYVGSDLNPYIVLDMNQSDEDMALTIAHELFHAIQFGYDPYFSTIYTDLNFSEGSAQAIAEYVLEDISLSQDYASYYFENYFDSLYGSNPYDALFPYSTYLWPKFLMANYGEDSVRRIFETLFDMATSGDYFVDMFEATDRALQAYYDTDIYEAYREFSIWNYDVDRYGDETLTEGIAEAGFSEYVSSYPFFRGVTGYDYYTSMTSPFGASYVHFDPSNVEENLKINVYGQDDAKWMVTIVGKRGKTVSELDHRLIYQNESEVSFTVENADRYSEIVMIMSPVPTGFYSYLDFSKYYSYSYYAEDVHGVDAKDVSGFEEGGVVKDLFWDMGAEDEYFYPIKALKAEGVIEGYQNSTFQSDRIISRGEFVKMLVTAFRPDADLSGKVNCFKDVYEGFYEEYVCYAKELGWVEGYDNGYFYPYGSVDKVTAVKVMLDAQGVSVSAKNGGALFSDVKSDAWYSKYLNKGYSWGLFDQKKGYRFDPGRSITRGEFADLLYRMMGVAEIDEAVDGKGISDIEVRDYFVFDEDAQFTYAIFDENGDRIGTEVVSNVDDCVGYTVCIAQESPSGRFYYYYKDDEVRMYQEIGDGGQIEYFDPLIVLADHDVVEFNKVEQGDAVIGGTSVELIDVVSSADVGMASYVYADGRKYEDVLKVDWTQVMNYKVVIGLESFYGVMMIDGVSYWAEGIGMVRQETSWTDEFMGEEEDGYGAVWEMVRS